MGCSEQRNNQTGGTACRFYGDQVNKTTHISDLDYHSCITLHPSEGRHWYQKQVDNYGFQIFTDKNYVGAFMSKTHDILWYLILAKHIIGLVNSIELHIGRLPKDGTIF